MYIDNKKILRLFLLFTVFTVLLASVVSIARNNGVIITAAWGLIILSCLTLFSIPFVRLIPFDYLIYAYSAVVTITAYLISITSGHFLYTPTLVACIVICVSFLLRRRFIIVSIAVSDACLLIFSVFAPKSAIGSHGAEGVIVSFILLHVISCLMIIIVNRTNKKLIMSNQKAEDANSSARVKNVFLANVSHEIRTPMNAILGMSELILQYEGPVYEDIRENALMIKNSCNNLLEIVNDLLDFSKIEQGKFELVESVFSAHSVIMDIVNVATVRLSNKDVKLKTNINPVLPAKLIGDDTRIKQIIMNLVTNACKFTDNGFVSLAVDFRHTGKGVNLIVRVEDTGIGIKKEDLKRIFNNFQQVDLMKNKNNQGTGIGLCITKGLINLMGGFIHVSSIYGEGSSFTVVLPLGESQGGERLTGEKQIKRFKTKDVNALVVDDNAVNLKVSSGLLKLYGIETDLSLSGPDALEKIRDKKYDLILLDHMMPGMDGIETAHLIRGSGIEHYRTVPIIALTANAIRGIRDMFLKNGFNEFIAKPIEMSILSRILTDFIPESKKISLDDDKKLLKEGDMGNISEKLILLDTNRGIANCGGSLEGYLEILKSVYDQGVKKISDIDKYYKAADYNSLRIEVHSLKSVAAAIGYDILSVKAYEAEKAARDTDIKVIGECMPPILSMYQTLLDTIKGKLPEIFEYDAGGGVADLDEIRAIVSEAAGYCESFDLDRVESLIRKIDSAVLETGAGSKIDLIIEASRQYNYSEVETLIGELADALAG